MIPQRDWLEGVFCWGVLAGWLSFWIAAKAQVLFTRWLDRNDRKLQAELQKVVDDYDAEHGNTKPYHPILGVEIAEKNHRIEIWADGLLCGSYVKTLAGKAKAKRRLEFMIELLRHLGVKAPVANRHLLEIGK